MAAFLTCTVLFFFQVNEGTNVVLQHNIVAGYERVAYRIDGEPCPGNENDLTKVKVDISAKFPMLAWTVKLITSGYISPVCTLNAQIEETRCRTEVLKDPPPPPWFLPVQVIWTRMRTGFTTRLTAVCSESIWTKTVCPAAASSRASSSGGALTTASTSRFQYWTSSISDTYLDLSA